MRFISFASNIGPAAAVPAGPAPSPLLQMEVSTVAIYYGNVWPRYQARNETLE